MKKILYIPLVLILTGFLFIPSENSSNHREVLFADTLAIIEQKLSSLTLREKIAQMIVSHSKGYSLDKSSEEYKRLQDVVVNEKVGGIIFFAGNSYQEAVL